MKFNYQNYGDILCGQEKFIFRLQGGATADVTLTIFLDENQYAYDIQITDERVPSEFRKINSADFQIFASLKIDMVSIFNDKQVALQHTIDVISEIMDKYDLVRDDLVIK